MDSYFKELNKIYKENKTNTETVFELDESKIKGLKINYSAAISDSILTTSETEKMIIEILLKLFQILINTMISSMFKKVLNAVQFYLKITKIYKNPYNHLSVPYLTDSSVVIYKTGEGFRIS